MKINQTFRYAVACLFELAKHVSEFQDADAISHRQNIPHAFTQKVLQHLAHGGLVYSQKGLGYRLARPLETITVLDVWEALSTSRNSDPGSPVVMSLQNKIDQAMGSISLAGIGNA